MKINNFLKIYTTAILVMFLTTYSNGAGNGEYGGSSLNFMPGGRELAMGETGVSHTSGGSAVFWNPSRVGVVGNRQFLLSRTNYVSDITQTFFALDFEGEAERGYGIGINMMNAGDIDHVDDGGATIGKFEPNDLAVLLSGGFPLGRHRFGVTGKYLSSKIISTAKTFSGDVGLSGPVVGNKLRYGWITQNIFGGLIYDEEESTLSMNHRVGISFQAYERLLFALEGILSDNDGSSGAIGLEYNIQTSDVFSLDFRGGFNSLFLSEKEEFAGPSLGAGIKYKNTFFDYAWAPMGELGHTHYLTLRLNWIPTGEIVSKPRQRTLGY